MLDPTAHPRYRWLILALGVSAQAATCSFAYGLPTLVPALRAEEHLSLLGASVVISAPTAGLLLTLIAWGAAADRYGERLVIVLGSAAAAVLVGLAAAVDGAVALTVTLGLAGAAGASVNAASGRVVMGWFSERERGLAMGARQTAQPLGVALAAVTLPPLARHVDLRAALAFPAALCGLVAVLVLVLVVDPPRPTATNRQDAGSPYREPTLWRVHAASALLVVPQFAVSAFTLVYLVEQRHWDATTAGQMIFWFQLAGAAGRVGAGVWSDAVRSRLAPMRQLALASGCVMALLAAGAWAEGWWIVLGFALGAVITVADNGLGYTAVAELAGRSWTGRALGVQNTGQNAVAMLTAPVLAAVIGAAGYGVAFAVTAALPLLAVPLTPVRAERAHRERSAAEAAQLSRTSR